MACINCNIEFSGDFCPSCGEKKNIDRITFFSIIESVFSGFMNMDKGLLFNIKNITLYPQKTILNYIHGKRRQVLNPISYAIITISVYLFVDQFMPRGEISSSIKEMPDLYGTKEMGYKLGQFVRHKMKFLWMSFALSAAIFTRLFYKKYNYFEHLAINFFILGHATILAIISRLIYNRELIIFNVFVYTYISILLFKVFKNPKDSFGTGALAIIVVFFSYLLFIGIPFYIANFF